MSEDTKKEEGKVKGFFNKAKNNVNSFLLENKIENTFIKNNIEFQLGIYDPESTFNFPKTIYGFFNNDSNLVVFGEKEIPNNSIIINSNDKKAYSIVKRIGDTPIEINVDETKYIRNGSEFQISDHVKEVEVIRIGNRSFLYEKPENK